MVDSRGSSEAERKTVFSIDLLDNTVVNFSQNGTTLCISHENAHLLGFVLNQIIVQAGPTPPPQVTIDMANGRGGLVSEPKPARFLTRNDTSPSDGRKHDDTFYNKMVVERRSDIEDRSTSFEEVIREKSALENELRQKNQDLIKAKQLVVLAISSGDEQSAIYNLAYNTLLKEWDDVNKKCGQLQMDLGNRSTAIISLKVDNENVRNDYEALQRKCEEQTNLIARLKKLADDQLTSSILLLAEIDDANFQCKKLILELQLRTHQYKVCQKNNSL